METPPSHPDPKSFPGWHYLVFTLFAFGCLIALLMNAWTSDDAFFSFRVGENFLNGYGFRFNISERVQIFTNPLWMMIHIPFQAIWHNIAYITLSISFVCAVVSLCLVLATFRLPPLVAAVFFLLPLSLSPTVTQFFSSGLENPMTSLLFAWFGYELWKHERPRWFWLSFIVSLSMVNRMDTVLAYVPIGLYFAYLNRERLPWRPVLLGALPILSWMAFSLFYFGFIFPNTKYAKLDTGIAAAEYVRFGANYVEEFAFADPVMALVMIAVTVHVLWVRLRRFRQDPADVHNAKLLMIGLGMILYTLYVVRVGGSYISLLFMSLPAFMALWLLSATVPPRAGKLSVLIAAGIAFGVVYHLPEWPEWQRQRRLIVRKYQISNFQPEFLFAYDKETGRLTMDRYKKKKYHCDADLPIRVTYGKGGRGSYYAGICTHQMGRYAISDALLSHLPTPNTKLYRTSHVARDLPEGYHHAIETDSLEKMHPDLAKYYAPLRLIITGDLWSLERLAAIVLFNVGYYDHWKEKYLEARQAECAPHCPTKVRGWP